MAYDFEKFNLARQLHILDDVICKVNLVCSNNNDLSIVKGKVKMINLKGVEITVNYRNYFVKWVNVLDIYSEETMKLNQLGL